MGCLLGFEVPLGGCHGAAGKIQLFANREHDTMNHDIHRTGLAALAIASLLLAGAAPAPVQVPTPPAPAPAAPAAPALPATPDAAAREATAAANAAKANIEVGEAWTRATPANATTAAVYLRISSVKDADRLIGAKVWNSDKAEIHNTTTVNGQAKMALATPLAIAGASRVAFAPGGLHVMLTGLRAPLRQGDSFLIALEFEKGGTQTTAVRVAAANANAAPPPVER